MSDRGRIDGLVLPLDRQSVSRPLRRPAPFGRGDLAGAISVFGLVAYFLAIFWLVGPLPLGGHRSSPWTLNSSSG